MATAAPPGALIVGLYGAFARRVDAAGWLAVGDVVRLLDALGVDEPAVRQAVSRMKRRGRLVSSPRSGGRGTGGVTVGYAPSPELAAILAEGDRRIFGHREPARLADGWVVAVFSVPESDRHLRHLLRSRLARLGFGNLASGVWLAPARLRDDADAVVERLGLEAHVDLFDARHLGFGDVAGLVARAWDLDGLVATYGAFVAGQEPVRKRWAAGAGTDERAFVDYLGALTEWRRLPYLDPGLPAEVLPAAWEGHRAAEIFHALHELLDGPALRHVRAVVTG
ncbi:MAG: PaaX family transcriptional regulator C-terminal domain-containing protein [Frankiaceae bacterium]